MFCAPSSWAVQLYVLHSLIFLQTMALRWQNPPLWRLKRKPFVIRTTFSFDRVFYVCKKKRSSKQPSRKLSKYEEIHYYCSKCSAWSSFRRNFNYIYIIYYILAVCLYLLYCLADILFPVLFRRLVVCPVHCWKAAIQPTMTLKKKS